MSKASEIMSRFDKSESKSLTNAIKAIEGDDYKKYPISNEKVFENIRDALREAFAELEARAMPDGYEWPRYEDGELVCIGNEVHIENEKPYPNFDMLLESITISSSGFSLTGADGEYVEFRAGERVKRPKVLAADGEPIETGQTVYATHYGYAKCTVLAIEWAVDGYLVEVENEGGHRFRQSPDEFTHQRPVLDADGVPIHEGDTVYLLPGEWCDRFPCLGFHGGEELEVFADGEAGHVTGSVKCREKDKKVGIRGICYPQPSQLTHAKPEPPDSWERIRVHMDMSANAYCTDVMCIDTSDMLVSEMYVTKNDDILRRCKALAERDAS